MKTIWAGLLLALVVFPLNVSAQDSAAPAAGAWNTVAAGTYFNLKMVDALTLDAMDGDHLFHAQTNKNVVANDRQTLAIPQGTDVYLKATQQPDMRPGRVRVTISIAYFVLNGQQHVEATTNPQTLTILATRNEVRAAGRTITLRLSQPLVIPGLAPAPPAAPAAATPPLPPATPAAPPTTTPPEAAPQTPAAPAPAPAPAPPATPAPVPAPAVVAAPQPPPAPPGPGPKITLNAALAGPLSKVSRPIVMITADGSRVFLVANSGSSVRGFLDGQPGPLVRDIPLMLTHNVTESHSGDSPAFSPDLKRLAYIVHLDGNKQAVVIDQTQSPKYDSVNYFRFSPVGHRLVYLAARANKQFVVDDGKAGPEYQTVDDGSIRFSADGEHVAYTARVAQAQPPTRVVLDGVEQSQHYAGASEFVFSRNGKHFGFLAGASRQLVKMVIDGQDGPEYASVDGLKFSDDGSRYVYIAHVTKPADPSATCLLVDNGTPGTPCTEFRDIVMSADGHRLAYMRMTSTNGTYRTTIVDNGAVGTEYNTIEPLQMSPDGKTLAYVATAPTGTFLVVNGREFGPYQSFTTPVAFSDDGGHWGCVVRTAEGVPYSALIDGTPTPLGQWVFIDKISFSQDGSKVMLSGHSGANGTPQRLDLTTAAASANSAAPPPSDIVYSANHQHYAKIFLNGYGSSTVTETVSVDEKPVETSGTMDLRTVCLSNDGAHLAYASTFPESSGSGSQTRVLLDGNKGPPMRTVRAICLSDDGQHLAYVGQDKNNATFVGIDGLTGPAFTDVLPMGSQFYGGTPADYVKFAADGSLAFFGVIDGKLYRCVYSADAIKAIPSMAAVSSVTAGMKSLHDFTGAPDGATVARIALGPDETIYGVSTAGGKYTKGTLFTCKTDRSGYSVLHSFYGGDDGAQPRMVAVAPDGSVVGSSYANGSATIIFKYDPKTRQFSELSSQPNIALWGICGGELVGRMEAGGSGSRDKPTTLWSMKSDGTGFQQIASSLEADNAIGNIGPDGAIYIANSKAVLKLATPAADPVVLHKFANSPDDGHQADMDLSFDRAGRVYGFTSAGGQSSGGVIFRVNPDGSDYRVIFNPDQPFPIGGVIAGDDGQVYGYKRSDSFGRDGALFKMPADGGTPEIVGEYHDNLGQHPYFFHGGAVIGFNQESIFRYQMPQASLASMMPTVDVVMGPAPAEQEQAVKFTEPANAP
jgi:hypothetical protein